MSIVALLILQAAAPVAAAQPQPAPAAGMELICRGGGAARQADTRTAYVTGSNGQSAWGTVNGSHSEGFEDQVDVRLSDTAGTIRMPRTMLPRIHGGDGGWFELKNLNTSPDAIEAEVGVSFINHPKVHIDRRTGVINIEGKSGHYTGQCERFDPSTQERRF